MLFYRINVLMIKKKPLSQIKKGYLIEWVKYILCNFGSFLIHIYQSKYNL